MLNPVPNFSRRREEVVEYRHLPARREEPCDCRKQNGEQREEKVWYAERGVG